MTKRYKKEERLSPKGKELVGIAKRINYFPYSSRYDNAAAKFMMSFNPEELNLYDRQKVGREIRKRMKDVDDKESVERKYSITNWKDMIQDSRYENQPGRIIRKLGKKKEADTYFEKAQKSEGAKDFQHAADFYMHAGERYIDLGINNKALTSYENALSDLEHLPTEEKTIYKGMRKDIEFRLNDIKNEIAWSKEKRLKQRVLPSVIAIAGVLGGLFFLSSNITGNAIANVSVQNSGMLGAGLLIVGLVAGFFYIKKR